jgi:hypothetical protein
VPHFAPVRSAFELVPGDLLAMNDLVRTSADTGHMMLVRSLRRVVLDLPLPNSVQYAVEVVDCTKDAHGHAGGKGIEGYPDTRATPQKNWAGAGFGHFIGYADEKTGAFVGARWSANARTVWTPSVRQLPAARVVDTP